MTPVATSSSSFSPLAQHHQRSSSVQKQRRHLEFDKDSSVDSSTSSTSSAAAPTVFKDHANGERQELGQHRSGNNNAAANLTHTAAAKLLQSSTGVSSSVNFSSNSSERSSSARSLPDLRSSTPEPTTVSSRLLTERNLNAQDDASVCSDSASTATTSSKVSASSPCSRSLDLQRSSSENSSFFHSIKASEKSSRQGSLTLPPAPHAKPPTDAAAISRKGRKASSQQEDIHALRLLQNRYLQWRYANAKSEAARQAQSRQAEMMVHSLGFRISEMYESVTRKRIELGRLQRLATLSTVLETQVMPYGVFLLNVPCSSCIVYLWTMACQC
ncbi:Protein ENDOSPERM DEFECTIVE 1 [Linum perenne]